MNSDVLARFDADLEAYAAVSRPALHSVLVQHRGEVISEHYWCGFTATSRQPIFSITKSVVSALVGMAIADGKLTLGDTVAQWFPEAEVSPNSHAASVTVQHLLTMTAGFQNLSGRIPGDAILLLLKRRAAFPPGEHFYYSNDDVDLLAVLLERAIGESALDYAHKRLFAPIGVWRDVPKSNRKRLWKVDKQGRARGSHGLYLNTHELAAFGQLYLQAGCWQGEQLLPADFVTASTTMQASGGYPERVKYGYLWWGATDTAGHPAFFASGAGGQYVYVLPARELVAVITTGAIKGDGRSHRVMVVRLVGKLMESLD
jgi:CubicO group peptidase (beta-lactamase class C family)